MRSASCLPSGGQCIYFFLPFSKKGRRTINELIASVGPPPVRPSRRSGGGLNANEVVRLSPLCYSALITNTLKRTRSKRYKLTTRLSRPSPSVSRLYVLLSTVFPIPRRVWTTNQSARRCLGSLEYFVPSAGSSAVLEKDANESNSSFTDYECFISKILHPPPRDSFTFLSIVNPKVLFINGIWYVSVVAILFRDSNTKMLHFYVIFSFILLH